MTDLSTDRAWSIEYENDTGPGDEGFWEWWTVTNGVCSFKCDSEDDAKWLLSRLAQPGAAVDTRYEQAMQIINAAWMALPESLRQRMADAQDSTGNPLPAAVRALAEGAAVDVPVGFQLMPVEPTEAMIQAAAETPQMKTVSGAVSFCADRFHWGDDRIGGTWDSGALAEAYRAMVAQHAAARGWKT